jgi:hypothetical protein
MIGLVGHFAGSEIETDVRRTLLYECHKTFIEICTALVLLADAYVPSYRARAELFAQHWQGWFPNLAKELPQLGAQVNEATREKLYPGSIPSIHPLDAFAQARAALLSVHRFYVLQLYGLEVAPDLEGCARLRSVLKREYFRTAVANWLHQRRVDNRLTRWALNMAYQRLQRFKFARGTGRRSLGAVWESLRVGAGPPIDIFLAAWCALAAADKVPNEAGLLAAEQALRRLPGIVAPWAASEWERYSAVREQLVQAYNIWEHYR